MDNLVTPLINLDGTRTIGTSRVVREQQGSWKWQIRLCRAFYKAVYSPHLKTWLWKSHEHSRSFSGGNFDSKNAWYGEGGIHNQKLTPIELAALQVVLEA